MARVSAGACALSVQVPDERSATLITAQLGAGLTSLPMGPVELDELDPGAVWIIRTLDVVAHVALDEVCDDAAAQVGMVIADSIAKAVACGPGGDIVRFPSAAEYVGEFAIALVEHRAESWVFGGLDGLRRLTPAAAVVTASEVHGVAVLDVLAHVRRAGVLDRVIGRDAAASAARLWSALRAQARPSATSPEDVDLAVGLLIQRLAERSGPGAWPAHAVALDVVVELVQRGAVVVTAEVLNALDRVQAAVSPLANQPVAERGPSGLSPIRRARRQAPADHARSDRGGVPATIVEVFDSPAAAVFTLLEAMQRAAVRSGTDELSVSERRSVARALLGGVPADRAITLACGGQRDLGGVDLDEATARIRAARHDGRADVTTPVPVDAVVDVVPAGADHPGVAIVRDPRTGSWLTAGTSADDAVARWERVHRVSLHLQAPPANWRDAAADVAWLLAGEPAPTGTLLLAHWSMRRFTAGLAGFHQSPAGYVVERLLARRGVISVDAQAITVELVRPPLHVVLAMAGRDAFALRVPWVDLPILVRHRS